MQTGMGLVPLTWAELQAFREETELDLMIWERELIKKMSEAYCGEYARASDPNRPCPYQPEVKEEEVDQIALAMRFMETLAAFKKGT